LSDCNEIPELAASDIIATSCQKVQNSLHMKIKNWQIFSSSILNKFIKKNHITVIITIFNGKYNRLTNIIFFLMKKKKYINYLLSLLMHVHLDKQYLIKPALATTSMKQ
jgi:hypothetical protein